MGMQSRSSSTAPTISPDRIDPYAFLRAILADLGPYYCATQSQALRAAQDLRLDDASFWEQLPGESDYHGVTLLSAPVIEDVFRRTPSAVPAAARRRFLALASRHRQAAAVREGCVDQLLAAFAAAGIPLILLKGAALAHLIYPDPELRPTGDIDILINPASTDAAVRVARDLGYSFASLHASDFSGRMHHLPAAVKIQSGFRIALEIHTDTMSPNQPYRLTFATLTAEPQQFRRRSGPNGFALGHTDMLRHLARHTFEPVRLVRLIHLYDLWRYPAIFHDQIDWGELEERYPYVIVVLRLMNCIFQETRSSAASRKTVSPRCPAGAGFGMIPLSDIMASDGGTLAKLSALFSPPAWWLHGFYGVSPGQSLIMCRAARHPLTIVRWLSARWIAAIGLGRE